MILRGELVDCLITKVYVKPREVNPQKFEDNQVKVIHAIHGRSEDDQESEEVYRSRLRTAHKLRRLSSVNAIASGSVNIGFCDRDLSRVQLPHKDPLVINLLVANCMIKRVLIDSGSSANIITKAVFKQLEIPSSSIRPTSSPLMGFDGTKVDPIGVIDISVTTAKRTLKDNFVLTEIHPSYNLIMERGWIHRMNGVPSTLHQVMRYLFPDGKEVIDLRGDQVVAKECYILTQNEAKKNSLPRYLKAEDEAEAEKPTEESLEAVEVILGDPQKVTYIGSSPTAEEKKALIDIIRRNANAFAWEHSDMVGINPLVLCHSLKLDPAGFIQEVHYPQWFSNVVVVQKKNGKWRVYIDFTNLNKACPKDSFPLPKIDQMVDATTGFERLTFVDAYSGYNQIPMNQEDEEKTVFITKKGTYCYRVMPFGLKNAGATY
ncbi:uncharacterized protein LOC132277823 [Cornus florida]|uniref:uncharacterized protein LOC132277823 n=1 Tax=Cornus florida TaxID=4283 RepID=UPI00289DD988|nr:uncharacterized protein LOC132277823 [Cornus florida]